MNTAPIFGFGDGMVTTLIGTYSGSTSVAVQTDGKILAAGYGGDPVNADFALVRYNTDGSLDTSFSGDGIVLTDFDGKNNNGNSVTVQADGKILLVGEYSDGYALTRYNTDGSLDTSFSGDGMLAEYWSQTYNSPANCVTVQTDGKILVTGQTSYVYYPSGGWSIGYDLFLARYNSDGSRDTSFYSNGFLTTNINNRTGGHSVTVQADGKILVTGQNFALMQFNSDGNLDTSFSGDGTVSMLEGLTGVSSITLQADGKILATGSTDGINFALARFNSNGSLDTSFSGDGIVLTDFARAGDIISSSNSVSVQADDKILVARYIVYSGNADFALVRYNTDGSLDTSFSGDGIVLTNFAGANNIVSSDITIQSDGKILVAGSSNGNSFALARFNGDGSLDSTFDFVSTLNGSSSYTENGAEVVLDNSVSVYDAELSTSGNYNGASITLARHGGANVQDIFGASGSLSFSDGNALLSNGIIGTVANAGGTLTITFNGSATQTMVDAVMSSITYANGSDAPPSSVQIEWTLSDGNTGSQGIGGVGAIVGSTIVTIAGTNDVPVAFADIGSSLTEDSTTQTSTGNVLTNDTDVDVGDTKAVTQFNGSEANLGKAIAGVHGALTLNADGSFDYTIYNNSSEVQSLKAGQTVTDMFTYTMSDAANTTSSTNISFNLTGANDAPVAHEISNQSTSTEINFIVPETAFTDIDGDTLIYTATQEDGSDLPAGLSFDASTRTFNGTGIAAGPYSIKVTASDGSLSDFATFALDVKSAVAIDDKGKFTGGDTGEFISGSDNNGADKMIGGGGNDTYVVDNKGDKVTEKSGVDTGVDEVQSSISYKLGPNLENLTLTGTDAINGTGNELVNTLTGNDSNNILDGGKKVDIYLGGDGDDTYLLDDINETDITEYAGEGTDTIKLKVNVAGDYQMADNIEKLLLTGTGLINVTGNDSDNTITGNTKANQLDSGIGDDSLYGGLGKDTLTGGDGADTFVFDTALSKANIDTVTDFETGIDHIALDDKIFKKLLGDTDLTDNFQSIVTGEKALDADNYLLYDSTTGNLYYDVDGSGKKAAVLVGVFDDGAGNHPALTGTDFLVV